MSDEQSPPDDTQPVPVVSQPAPDGGRAAPVRVPFRDQVLGVWGVAVVAAVSLVLGALAGAALTVLASDHGSERWREGPGGRHGQMWGPMMNGGGQQGPGNGWGPGSGGGNGWGNGPGSGSGSDNGQTPEDRQSPDSTESPDGNGTNS